MDPAVEAAAEDGEQRALRLLGLAVVVALGCQPRGGRAEHAEATPRPAPLVLQESSGNVCALVDGTELTCWRGARPQLVRRLGRPARDFEMVLDTWCLVHFDGSLECGGCQMPMYDCAPAEPLTGGPWAIDTPAPLVEVELGVFSACGVTADRRRVLCWGHNERGELGRRTPREGLHPAGAVPLRSTARVEALEMVLWGACALFDDGELHCWGHLPHGHLPTPRRVLRDVHELRMSGDAACVIQGRERAIRCAGQNHAGELGSPDLTLESSVFVDTGVRAARTLAHGSRVICALLEDGVVECWGRGLLRLDGARGNQSPSTHRRFGPFDGATRIVGSPTLTTLCVLGPDRPVACFPDSQTARLIEGATRGGDG